jgi:hypothetical protein
VGHHLWQVCGKVGWPVGQHGDLVDLPTCLGVEEPWIRPLLRTSAHPRYPHTAPALEGFAVLLWLFTAPHNKRWHPSPSSVITWLGQLSPCSYCPFSQTSTSLLGWLCKPRRIFLCLCNIPFSNVRLGMIWNMGSLLIFPQHSLPASIHSFPISLLLTMLL